MAVQWLSLEQQCTAMYGGGIAEKGIAMEKHGDVKLWHGDALHASRRYSNPEQGFAVRRHGDALRSRGKAMQGEAKA